MHRSRSARLDAIGLESGHGESSEPEILLVDADPDSRAALRDMILPLARVQELTTGEEALEVAGAREVAAIVIDVALPGLDGFQTVKQLRKKKTSRNVPVLFLSESSHDWLTIRRGYALGALGYMTKPVDGQVLRAKLDVLLTLFRRGLELRKRDEMIAQQHEAIRQAHAALEQVTAANKAKDLYMGVLGHDLRNPLGAILMSARMLLMRDSLGQDERHTVSRMARNAERMAALIRDILDYTRGQAVGGIPIVPRSTNMRDICSAMVDEVKLLHPDRAIRLAASGDHRGFWDRERVEQVIANLLTNALTHGTGVIELMVDGSSPDEVAVSIANDGAIVADELPHLFEPFRRGAKSRVGLGLGLYIVSEIMRAHGGAIEVASTVVQGTTFTTRWPRRAAQPSGLNI